jgi:hypothetical protein
VGLVLAPPGTLPFGARVAGLASVVLLLIATCILVASSLAHAKVGTVTGFRRFIRAFSIWHAPVAGPSEEIEKDPVAHSVYLVKQAEIVTVRISRLTDIGLWVALLAVVTLVGALAMTTFRSNELLEVSVRLPDGTSYADCPRIDGRFEAKVDQADLTGVSPLLPVVVESRTCGTPIDKTIYLTRASVEIVQIGAQ